jgi:glycosyltransferase involved in cell wall biosynthesis/putative flippase GtrA
VIFTLAVFGLLDWIYGKIIGVQATYWISAAIGVVNGFIWQRTLVWRSENRWHGEFARFFLLNIAAAASNSLMLFVAVDRLALPALPSEISITVILVGASFIVTRFWVFRTAKGGDQRVGDELVPRRVEVFLQYYKPHVSGLTNMAADLAEYMARNGFEVHVRCVSADRSSSITVINGVKVHAYRRSFSLGRGAFSIPLIQQMWRMRFGSGIVHAHMPYPESFLLAWILGPGWKLIATFQCDAPLTGGPANLIARALDASQRVFMRRADFAVSSSHDYARHSRLSRVLADRGATAIPATSADRKGGVASFSQADTRYVGFLGRPTSEKGIDVVLDALEALPADVCLLLAGPTVGLSEKASFDRAQFDRLAGAGRIRSLGFLDENQIADFYASLSVFLLPSTNSFEAFGIVQVEAISAGTPVVASDLPGVRTIVQNTGFGEIAAINDAADLARCIVIALESHYDADAARRVLEELYLSPKPEEAYLELYKRMLI